ENSAAVDHVNEITMEFHLWARPGSTTDYLSSLLRRRDFKVVSEKNNRTKVGACYTLSVNLPTLPNVRHKRSVPEISAQYAGGLHRNRQAMGKCSMTRSDPAMFIRGAIQGIAHKFGFHVSRISNAPPEPLPFGREVWVDIARLSERWGLPINRVFDAGANIGRTSLAVLAPLPSATVYSVEPHPDTFRKLAEGLAGRRARAFNIGLSDKSGNAQLFTYGADVLNSLSPTTPHAVRFGTTGKPIPIQVSTVDEFCSSHDIDTIDVLKVDTEGCDLDVLKGAAGKLKS